MWTSVRALTVQKCSLATEASRTSDHEEEESMRIFIGNLAFTTTEEELNQLFESYGIVEHAQILQDRETGRSRGFGFVKMPNAPKA
jgi:RNA recognition motif-containing protein